MKNTILLTFAVAGLGVTAFPADQRIAFERNDAVYIANLDGTGEKRSPSFPTSLDICLRGSIQELIRDSSLATAGSE